jgi:ribosomal protein S16
MRVRIKLRDMGIKKNPKIWLIVQPATKNLKGKYLERIGIQQS